MEVKVGADARMEPRAGGCVRRLAAAIICLAATAALHPGPAAAQAPESIGAPVPQSDAERALDAASAALDPQPGAPELESRQVTLALRDLALALPNLEGADRREARGILARPTQYHPDPEGTTYLVPEAAPYCGAHFCIHYVATSADAPSLFDSQPNGVPDYVEEVSAAAERSYDVLNGALGWPVPVSDGSRGNPAGETRQGLIDVYLADIGDEGIFGYATTDPPRAQQCRRSCFAYLVLDDDYSPKQFRYADPTIPLEVTTAHEYNHVLQLGIDALQDGWLLESTAVWSEENVFPDGNDYLNYLPSFAATPGTPITKFGGAGGRRIYGLGVFQHWLDRGEGNFGPSVVLGSWLASELTNPQDFAVGAVDRSIRDRGGAGFAAEFGEFAAASAEWRTAGGFPDGERYPDVARKGRLDARAKRFRLDHTAYRLLDVVRRPRSELTLRVEAEPRTRTAIALVGRDDDTATVTRSARLLVRGGNGSVTLRSPGRFERVTAVIANADGRTSGYASGDWRYTRDNREFTARLAN